MENKQSEANKMSPMDRLISLKSSLNCKNVGYFLFKSPFFIYMWVLHSAEVKVKDSTYAWRPQHESEHLKHSASSLQTLYEEETLWMILYTYKQSRASLFSHIWSLAASVHVLKGASAWAQCVLQTVAWGNPKLWRSLRILTLNWE